MQNSRALLFLLMLGCATGHQASSDGSNGIAARTEDRKLEAGDGHVFNHPFTEKGLPDAARDKYVEVEIATVQEGNNALWYFSLNFKKKHPDLSSLELYDVSKKVGLIVDDKAPKLDEKGGDGSAEYTRTVNDANQHFNR